MSTQVNKISFTDLDVSNLMAFIDNADINLPQILDLTKDKLISRGFPDNKKFIKMFKSESSNIFGKVNMVDGVDRLHFGLKKLSWLKDRLNIFDASGYNKIDGYFSVEKSGETGIFNVNYLMLNEKNNKLKIKCIASDLTYMSTMTDKAWDMMSNVDNTLVRFDIETQFITKLKKLLKLESSEKSDVSKEKEISIILHASKDGSISFSSKEKNKWNVELDSNNKLVNLTDDDLNYDGKLTFLFPDRMLNAMDYELYTLYLVFNKDANTNLYVLKRNEDDIYISTTVKYDPNIHKN